MKIPIEQGSWSTRPYQHVDDETIWHRSMRQMGWRERRHEEGGVVDQMPLLSIQK
ncbi:hypothetical protein [Pseudoxanthomonas mexicana]|uniref:hypothetical protein n=1 Tax=Pseudoxanthomonas mexicana TaxID=128785 RepID=UPI0022F3BD02|nr:hypothetical protein [Pseudoxanthomonas mexicana]WBX94507.1 hypothetical protein PE064_04755 [Pseudoxanthomonas mexicana]